MDTGWDRESEAQASLDYGRGVGRPTLNGIVVTRRHPPHWGHATPGSDLDSFVGAKLVPAQKSRSDPSLLAPALPGGGYQRSRLM